MKAILGCALGLIVFGTVSCAPAVDDYKEAIELERLGNAWKTGDRIPAKLLEYRTSQDGSCFSNPRGTEKLFQAITNYVLLREIALLPKIDSRVFSNSVIQAVVLSGPNRFFADLAAALKQHPELEKRDRIKILKNQSKVRHIVVDSLRIDFADMAPDSARKVLDEISRELRDGEAWHDVYWKFMKKYEYSYEDKLSGGTIHNSVRTKIGNLGDFFLPEDRNALFSFREQWMPNDHIKTLFMAKAGDILILFEKEDMSRYSGSIKRRSGESFVLHRVREVYTGM